jgi:methanethiol S-methyltransferase
MNVYFILFLYWLLFYGVHSITASSWLKNLVQTYLPLWVGPYRFLYNLVSLVLFALAFNFQRKIMAEPIFEKVVWLSYLGLVGIGFSFAFMVVSFRNYSKSEFFGMEMWRTKSFNSALGRQLNIGGLNQLMRHPLYTASCFFFIAYFLYKPFYSTLVFSTMGCIYLYVGTLFEEKKLVQQFGKQYQDYQEKVPMFFPLRLKKKS